MTGLLSTMTLSPVASLLLVSITISGALKLDLDTVSKSKNSPSRTRHLPLAVSSQMRKHGQMPIESGYSYKTLWYDQKIDHFGFANGDTFKNRYLLADQFWNRNGGPIFFYTGNEGDIEWFCNNTGLMWDIAPDFRALLVFVEHRYYGKSMPFGSESYKDKRKLNFLTSEQALADFAEIIGYLKSNIPGAENSPVVAFGGSYGGMLSAWFRIKYPNVIVGALAASAPIWQFTGITPCNAFDDVVTNTWARVSQTCASNIHNSYSTFQEVASTAEGLKFISDAFGLCKPLEAAGQVDALQGLLESIYVELAEVDYPYPANFLANLPGWPVTESCRTLMTPLTGRSLVTAMSHITNLFFNYTGDVQCINLTDSYTPSVGVAGWDYQSCTEMVMPMCTNGSGLFRKADWNFDANSDYCFKRYGVRPRRDWITLQYWGQQLQSASNIIFSNGDLDPWSSGGVSHSFSSSVVAIKIKEGGHHLDLRAANEKDTQYVRDARERELNLIREWLGITESPTFTVV